MNIPINLDQLIGMTIAEAKDYINLHSDVNIFTISKDGEKMAAPFYKNAIYITIEDDKITSYSNT